MLRTLKTKCANTSNNDILNADYFTEKKYPYIINDANISNGSPIIEGTRIKVWTVAGYYQMGMSVDEILIALSHLKASQVHSALAYYFDHQDEIDEEIAQNQDIDYWKKSVKNQTVVSE
ncbi:DUF433 domain-containing protein [candidate division KSB1 bacterium]|nr:DUF433 domain-containing protein [candidate division KSB1 bacterium]RQW01359.1 MAG: DUF433 domain-containing protein [candidate division KSB1 bacterium]